MTYNIHIHTPCSHLLAGDKAVPWVADPLAPRRWRECLHQVSKVKRRIGVIEMVDEETGMWADR